MRDKRPTTSGPVEVTDAPRDFIGFHEAQVLKNEVTGARAPVLKASEEGQKALLYPLDEPEWALFEANASWAVGWDDAYLEGPRLV